MPNHITSRLKITGEATKVAEVFNFIKADTPEKDGYHRLFDLEKIYPMPKALDIDSSSLGEDGTKYLVAMAGDILERNLYQKSCHYAHMKEMEASNPKMFEKAIEEGKIRLHNIADYGVADWYQWRLQNWGTKWNTYEYRRLDDNTIEFQTAWNGIPNMVRLVAEKFPEVTIEYKYADEDWSNNVGSFIFHGDEVEDFSPEDCSPEAWELVFELGVANREDFVQEPDGTWKYREDDDED